MNKPRPATDKGIPTMNVVRGIMKPVRWRILSILHSEGPLPPIEIRKRLGMEQSLVSKQLTLMKQMGVLEHWVGTLYRIPERFLIPGEQALDFGAVVVRLDHTPAP